MNIRLTERRQVVETPNRSDSAVETMDVDHIGPMLIDSKPYTPEAALAATDNCIRIAAFAAAYHLAYSL